MYLGIRVGAGVGGGMAASTTVVMVLDVVKAGVGVGIATAERANRKPAATRELISFIAVDGSRWLLVVSVMWWLLGVVVMAVLVKAIKRKFSKIYILAVDKLENSHPRIYSPCSPTTTPNISSFLPLNSIHSGRLVNVNDV